MKPGWAEHDASEAVRLKMKDFWPRLATFNFTESPERILQPRTIVAKDSRWGSLICFKMVPWFCGPQVMITSRLYTLQEGVTFFLSTVRFQCSCYLSRLQWMFTLKHGAYIAVSFQGPVCDIFFRKPTWQLVSYLVHDQTGFIIKWRCKMAAS